jgi:hypothetical protein
MTTLAMLPLVFGGTVGVWTVSAVLTLLLIGPVLVPALVLTFATDDADFDRAVDDVARNVRLKARARADDYGAYERRSNPEAPSVASGASRSAA